MSSSSKSFRTLAILAPRVIPLLALLCLWTLFACTGLYWGGAKIYESLWLFYVTAGLWLLLAAHAVTAWFQGKRVGGWVDLAVLAFLVYFALWYRSAPIEFLARMEGLWILSYAGIFLAIRYVFPQRGWLIAVLVGFLLVALVCCGYAFSKIGQPIYPIWGEARPDYGIRISGFFGSPNNFGNYMVLGALTAAVLAGIASFPWVLRICLFYVAGMLSAGVFLSLSRGSYAAWLTGILLLATFFFYRSMLGWIWKAAVAVGVVASVAGAFVLNQAAATRGSMILRDDFRFQLFAESWQLWQRYPLWGHGPATFDYEHQRFHGPEFLSRAYFTHNDYLNTLCDYGAVGLSLVLIFVGVLAFAFRCPKDSIPTERQQNLSTLGWVVLAAMSVHAMTEFNFHIPACAVAFFAIVGVAASRTERQQRAPLCLPLNFLLAGTALAAAFFLVTTAWKTQKAKAILPYTNDGLVELRPEQMLVLANAARLWDPSSPAITVRVGDALRVRLAGIDDQINLLRKSPEPSDADGSKMADLLVRRHELGEQALEFYRLGEKANPLDDSLQIKVGMVLDLMDRSQEAYLYYQKALQNQPHNRFFVHVLGYHFLRTGNVAKARECFLRVQSIGIGRNERNRETMDQARQALQMINRFEKQQAAAFSPAPLPAKPLPVPVPPPSMETAPVESPPKRSGQDAPILGPSRETPEP